MRAIQTLSPDDVLEILLDNPPSVRDIPIALRKQGYEVADPVRTEHGAWKIELTLSP
jgi:TusA-related sulfurtransferase